jgi:hypothetical protein
MKLLIKLYQKCKKSDSNFIFVTIRFIVNLIHQNTTIKVLKNIESKKKLRVAADMWGLCTDRTQYF